MATFQDIIGQEQIVEHLKTAVETGNVNHAYILQGERSCGKEFIAKVFAKALQCEHPQNGEPCCECQSCKQADSGNQPDIIRVTHEKPNTIGVEDIRKITGDVAIKPYSSKRKIYIINEAEKMTVQAQNALLKTLEEPPAYVVILLLTTNVDAMLQTIQSRCILLTMKPVRDELVKQYLMRDVQVPDYKADVCVAFARGNVGRAKALASSEEFDNIKQDAVALLKYIREMEITDILTAIKKISEYKFEIDDYLDIMAVWYRDVLLFKATNDINHLIFKDELPNIKKTADQSTYEGIEIIIDALETAKARLKANVSFDLTMELLLLTMKEN
ncbi:MAG: DNA polymerase III subunit delta' [Lachnospiraceae bacterium]|nr:DNA polymerase III subunit delta' [Lachnospiraceae bacterium]MDD5853469.1 DNA polymerase III subunit delta' [Lachnospiraceae bacterium]